MIRTINGIYDIDVEDCWIRNHMMQSRVFEHDLINCTLKEIVEKSTYIVDVGANIGCHTVSYGIFNPLCKIYAFEPQKSLYHILEKNIQHNNLQHQVQLYNYGLGHREMNTELNSFDKTDQDPQQVGCNKGGLGIGSGGEKIKVITLDTLMLPGLDFMKIDVEGAEGLVIQGAQKTIETFKPIICFEHNYQRVKSCDVDFDHVPTPFEELAKLGYTRFICVDGHNYLAFHNINFI